MEMYEVEVYVGDPYPQDLTMRSAEAMEHYEEKKMSVNLTRIWQLGGEEYPHFLFHLIGTIIHEFLHLFFYDNKMFQENTEAIVHRLAHYLRLLSVGGLIGVDDTDVEQVLGISRRLTVTIDTNYINTKQGMEAMNKIEKWHNEGLVEIVKTDVMDTEFMRAHEPQRFVKKSQKYHEDLGVGVWGHSRWGHSLWGGKKMNYPHKEIRNLLFPQFHSLNEDDRRKATRDAMHLAAHYMYKRDFFVTEDKHFIRKRNGLKKRFGVVVLTPKECVEKVSSRRQVDN